MFHPIITNKPLVCDRVTQLRRSLSTDRNETWQIDPDQVKERFYINRFGKCQPVAMEIRKNIVKFHILTQSYWFLSDMVIPSISIRMQKMKKIYHTVPKISPIATVQQPDSDWGSGEIVTSLMTSSRARVTSSRARRHVTSYYGPMGRARSTQYAKFRIFQIGPLLAEIRPF